MARAQQRAGRRFSDDDREHGRLPRQHRAGVGAAMLAGGAFRRTTAVASLIGAAVALVLMALFYVYQKWRYDATPGQIVGRAGG